MPDLFDQEYNRLSKDLEDASPREEIFPSEEKTPREFSSRADEYNENAPASFPRAKTDQHKKLKSRFLRPLTGVIVGAAVLFASIGFDPLGLDLFGGTSAPASPSSSTTETVKKPAAKDPNASSSFPKLPNQDPDFAGDYAWASKGPATSEEYLILKSGSGTQTFFVAGGYYRSGGAVESNLPGAQYDRDTNTLTLTDFFDAEAHLDGNLMGNGFKIRLEGTNYLRSICLWGAMYGGSVTFTGSGTLIIGEGIGSRDPVGILLQAESSPSAMMVESGVTLEIYGTDAAFLAQDSTAKKGLYYLHPLHLYGGVPVEWAGEDPEAKNFTVADGEKNADHILISSRDSSLEHGETITSLSAFPANPDDLKIVLWDNDNPADQKPVYLAVGDPPRTNDNYRGQGITKVYRSGLQNDHYLVIDDVALVRGSACGSEIPAIGTIPGVTCEYDDELMVTVLTLTNFTGGVLKMRLMGTVEIRLVGKNELDHIEILNYFSLGSIRIAGEGENASLTVNAEKKYSKGILLDAQFGSGYLIVFPSVKMLDVYGGGRVSTGLEDDVNAAIFVKANQWDTASIRYLSDEVDEDGNVWAGSRLIGGERKVGAFEYDYDLLPTTKTNEILNVTEYFHDCTVVDENGAPSQHVKFVRAETEKAGGEKDDPAETETEKGGKENGKGPRIPVIAVIGAVLIVLVLALLLIGFLTGKKKKKEE